MTEEPQDVGETVDRAIYQETRKDLLARQISNSENFDKAILTLSTAALGLSLGFLKDFACDHPKYIWLLTLSWWLLALAIICTILSFLVSQQALKVQLDWAAKYYLEQKFEYGHMRSYAAMWTDILNWLAGIIFIVAIVLTILFVSFNVGELNMAKKEVGLLKEGATIPSLQPARHERGQMVPTMQPSSKDVSSQTSQGTQGGPVGTQAPTQEAPKGEPKSGTGTSS